MPRPADYLVGVRELTRLQAEALRTYGGSLETWEGIVHHRIYYNSDNILLDLSSSILLRCKGCSGKAACQLVGKETEVTRNQQRLLRPNQVTINLFPFPLAQDRKIA